VPDALLTAAGAGGVLAFGVGSAVLAEALVRRTRPGAGRWRPVVFAQLSVLLLTAVAVRYRGEPSLAAAYLVLAAVAVPISVSDVAEHRIPDRVLGPACALTGVLLAVDAAVRHTPAAFVRALLCAVVLGAGALAVLLVSEESLGLGDAKLLAYTAACAGYRGWGVMLAGLLLTLVAAAAGGLVLRLAGRLRPGAQIPLAPYALLSTVLVFLR
jgi:leader peptidase (prepilin peptidase)/N-methyltransferase